MNVTSIEIIRAYRAAKVEAFRDPNCAHGLKFLEFERDLIANLEELRRVLNARRPRWQRSLKFIGGVACIPKSLGELPRSRDVAGIHYQDSDPIEQWCRECDGERVDVEFRPVIDASVSFMIVSALWIQKVGHLFDARLDTRYAVGSRLWRLRPEEGSPAGTAGELHPYTHGLFAPYYNAYGRWRSRGLKVMRRELKDGNRIVAVTMDLQRFYHKVNARFLLNADYLQIVGVQLTEDQEAFTTLLIEAFELWNEESCELFGGDKNGLPVGLTCSQVIANVLLQEFDRFVVSKLSPAYYARYVDDVFLVLRHPEPFDSGAAFVRWLGERLRPLGEPITGEEADQPSIQLKLRYAPDSELKFVGKKQKIFQLEGRQGIDLIGPIEEQIRTQSSEHRNLPCLPNSENAMAHRALLVTSDATLSPDALRKADMVTLRRSGFAMLLSDIEAHVRDLQPPSWKELRREFIGLARRQLAAPKAFFDYYRYLPRVVGVMVASGDFDDLRRFLRAFKRLFEVLRRTGRLDKKQNSIKFPLEICLRNLGGRIFEAILQASSSFSPSAIDALFILEKVFRYSSPFGLDKRALEAVSSELPLIDWSRKSYASVWLDSSEDARYVARPNLLELDDVIDFDAFDRFRSSAQLPLPHWPALAFPTRPIPQREITTRAMQLIQDGTWFSRLVRAMRGTWMPQDELALQFLPGRDSEPPRWVIPAMPHREPMVAITSFAVTDEEWSAAAVGTPVLTLERYRRLNDLLNSILACPRRPDYVLFPECALPQRWAMPIATRLTRHRISLIAGLEYRSDNSNERFLRNEALVALATNFPGYQTNLCMLQPKERAAWHEDELLRQRGRQLVDQQNTVGIHPVYVHQEFCFGVLICSELTDIQNRSSFQGKVDAIFVPEWNQDIESFSALVEASALDVHCFIVQANNRRFGDSRIRAPFKASYARDVVRLKGGENDYFVVGRIDFMELRRFQSHAIPPSGESARFKPFPLGFPANLSTIRRAIPL